MKLLKEKFVPVAIDQWYQRRQKDAEGDFWRKIAGQGPRKDFEQTTQGHYICDAEGTLFGFNGNHVDLSRIKKFMKDSLADFDPDACKDTKVIERGVTDSAFDFRPPENGLVLRVYSKVLEGYAQPRNDAERAFQNSVGQDNLWITADEQAELVESVRRNGELSPEIAMRMARYHLIDNTRGEPPRWRVDQVKLGGIDIKDGQVSGTFKIETEKSDRGFEGHLFGYLEVDGNELTRFDLAAEGLFWGEGRFTRRAPEGKFPLAIVFRLADPTTTESRAIPHGAKGWVDGYYNSAEK